MEHLLSSCRCSFVVRCHPLCLFVAPAYAHSHPTTEQWHGIEMNERTQKSFINTAEMRRCGDEWAGWMATEGEALEDTRDLADAEKGEQRKSHPRSSLTRCIRTHTIHLIHCELMLKSIYCYGFFCLLSLSSERGFSVCVWHEANVIMIRITLYHR